MLLMKRRRGVSTCYLAWRLLDQNWISAAVVVLSRGSGVAEATPLRVFVPYLVRVPTSFPS